MIKACTTDEVMANVAKYSANPESVPGKSTKLLQAAKGFSAMSAAREGKSRENCALELNHTLCLIEP